LNKTKNLAAISTEMLSGLEGIKLSNPSKHACAAAGSFGRIYEGRFPVVVGAFNGCCCCGDGALNGCCCFGALNGCCGGGDRDV
jgi:hypothetical protein